MRKKRVNRPKTFRLTDECHDLLELLSAATGMSESAVIEHGVRLEALTAENRRLIDVYRAKKRLDLQANNGPDVDLRIIDEDE